MDKITLEDKINAIELYLSGKESYSITSYEKTGFEIICPNKKNYPYKGNVEKITPNILKRDFVAIKPNQEWVTDVTEFHLFGEKLYLAPVLELFNRGIIAYNLEKCPIYRLVSKMLEQAFTHLSKGDAPVLHSDQGWHYQMQQYAHALKEHGITQSMTTKGNCLDNIWNTTITNSYDCQGTSG